MTSKALKRPMPPAPPPLESIVVDIPFDQTDTLHDDWWQWIAEQRLRGCTPASMLATMTGAGIDASTAGCAIADIEDHPVFRAARRVQQLHRKLISVVGNLQEVWRSAPGYGTVDRCKQPSRSQFLTRYVYGCRPVVLTDIARDWPAMRRWSPQDLKARFGHLTVEVQAERNADVNYEANKFAHRREVKLGEFVDRVLAKGPTNDHYLTANNEVLRRVEFAPLLADIGTLPHVCDRAQLAGHSSFWFGPGGTVTPLHHDTLMLFHTQVVGCKRWRFISPLDTPRLYNHYDVYSAIDLEHPDLARHPDLSKVQVLEVIVHPGETVFLPHGWWHQVTSLDTSLSLSYSNLDLPGLSNSFRYDNPDIRNW